MPHQTSKPNVLVYRDFLLPSSETFVRNQAENLQRFTPYYLGLRRLENGLELPAERVITIQHDGLLGDLGRGLFKYLGVTPTTLWRVLRIRPRMIHAHFGVDATRIMRLARYLRLPLLVTLHDYDVTTSDSSLRRLMPYADTYIRRRPQLNRQASAFLAVSEFLKRKAIERGFAEDKLSVHYIGIDTARFQETNVEREPLVLFVGRLVEKKGCIDLIQAMANVQRMHPDVELVVIGDGDLRQALEARAATLLSKFRFLGAQPSAEVQRWLSKARVFCAPSVTAASGETEGLPITVMEAMASGTPVVSTRHAGIPEAVIHGETGLLVAEHDSQDLERQLLAVLENREFASRLASAGRKLVATRFDLRRQTSSLEDVYARVIKTKRDTLPLQSSRGGVAPR